MPEGFSTDTVGCGKLSHGPDGRLVERTLEFVARELPKWRDDPNRSTSPEEALNSDLCKHLDSQSRKSFPMVYFHHEERQAGRARVDISALPSDGAFVGDTYHSFRDPLIVFEGKILPAPSKDREQEYVTGGAKKSGGIQRFKLSLHGANHKVVCMIGYVQEGELADWLKQINTWIQDLDGTTGPGGEAWTSSEQIGEFVHYATQKLSLGSSTHPRVGDAVSNQVQAKHLWVQMN